MSPERMRIDKWLWAARFYKTRRMAREAIEGGKVQCRGVRVKPGREVEAGMEIRLRQGFDEKTVIVRALSGQRRGAPEAQRLYEETAASIAARESKAGQRRRHIEPGAASGKPDKKQRRLLRRQALSGGKNHP